MFDYIYKRIEELFIEYLKTNDPHGKEGLNIINYPLKKIINLEDFFGKFIIQYINETKKSLILLLIKSH